MVTEGDKKLTSSVFELEVVKSINSEKSIVSTNEFTALLNGLAALSEYDNYKNSVKEMEINKANKAEVEEKFISVEEKIKNNSEQLDNIETEQKGNKQVDNKAILTIIDDDGKQGLQDRLVNLCNTLGFKISMSIITGKVGNSGYLTLDEIKNPVTGTTYAEFERGSFKLWHCI